MKKIYDKKYEKNTMTGPAQQCHGELCEGQRQHRTVPRHRLHHLPSGADIPTPQPLEVLDN